MICFKQNLEQRFLGHNQSTSLILGWFFSAFPVVQLFVLSARELKLDTSSQEPRSGPKFQTWVVFNYYSSAQLNPQLSSCLCAVGAARHSGRVGMWMGLLGIPCVLCCGCVSSVLSLWYCLSCQAEMVSCGSELPSWKSSLEVRVQMTTKCLSSSLIFDPHQCWLAYGALHVQDPSQNSPLNQTSNLEPHQPHTQLMRM